MASVLRLLVLMISVCVVLAANVGGTCEHWHDRTGCDDTSDDESQKYSSIHQETRVFDRDK